MNKIQALVPLLFLMTFFDGSIFSSLAPLFGLMALGQGLTPVDIGFVLSSLPLSQLICYPFLGFFSSGMQLKTGILLSLCVSIIRCLAMAYPLSGRTLLLSSSIFLQVAEGMACALMSTSSVSLIICLFPDRATRLLPLFESSYAFGAILGPAMSGLLYEDLGYGAPFLLTAAVNVLFFVAAIFLVPSSAGRQKEDPPSSSSSPEDCKSSSPLVKLLKRRRLWLAIGIEVWAQVIIGYMDSAVPVCMLQLALRPLLVTMAFVASAISFCVSSFLTGSLMRGSTRFADLLIVLSLLVLGSAFSLFGPMFPLTLPPVVSPAVATLVSQSLLGLASGTLHVTAVTIGLADLEDMGDTRDESFSTAYASLILSATTLGLSLGPVIGSNLTEFASIQLSSTLMCGLHLAMAVLWFVGSLIRHQRRSSCVQVSQRGVTTSSSLEAGNQ